MKRLAEIWSSFPAEHKKRFYQALGGYVLLMAGVSFWISSSAQSTLKDWQSRIPSATVPIKSVYLTPQITETSPEQTPSQPLPGATTAPVATTPAQVSAPAFTHDNNAMPMEDNGVYISVVVSGLGLSPAATERAINDLPPGVSLAFSPYADDVSLWVKKSVKARHETLLMMPMESGNYPLYDPGPRALSSRLSDQDNADNLTWLLNRGKGAVGVVNFMGSRFLDDKKRLLPVFESLQRNGAMFVQTPGIAKSDAASVADQANLPFLAGDVQIDGTASEAAIREQFAQLEKMAHERGYAVGFIEPYPLSFNMLKTWAAKLESHGITLAPLATVWKNKPRHEETAAPPAQPLPPAPGAAAPTAGTITPAIPAPAATEPAAPQQQPQPPAAAKP